MTDLLTLANQCEQMGGASLLMDQKISDALRPSGRARLPAYTASIDAAVTLVPAGMKWSLFSDGCAGVGFEEGEELPTASTWAATPALALCAAALRARASLPREGREG